MIKYKPCDPLHLKAIEPLQAESLPFAIQFQGVSGTQLINLGRMKDWVDLAVAQWFWAQGPWIGNPVA